MVAWGAVIDYLTGKEDWDILVGSAGRVKATGPADYEKDLSTCAEYVRKQHEVTEKACKEKMDSFG